MKSSLALVLFLATSVFAQDGATLTQSLAACGPREVHFEAKEDSTQHPTPLPEPGKALVYVVEDLGQCSGCAAGSSTFFSNVDRALTRLGMDGAWVGANHGSTYFFFTADPGEHHLCLNWQSRFGVRSRAFSLANFTAEEGRVYFFRARVFPGHDDYSFDLDAVNSDQGKFLVASSAFSVSHPKK
jgi:hypothetical protein